MNRKKKAEECYHRILREIEKLTGNTTTYLSDLNKIGKILFGAKFHGVYPADKIPQLSMFRPYTILNLDRTGEIGSHWVALIRLNNNTSLFYDSYGRHNTQLLSKLNMSGNGRIIDSENDAEQEVLEKNCGARCLAFLSVYNNMGKEYAMYI